MKKAPLIALSTLFVLGLLATILFFGRSFITTPEPLSNIFNKGDEDGTTQTLVGKIERTLTEEDGLVRAKLDVIHYMKMNDHKVQLLGLERFGSKGDSFLPIDTDREYEVTGTYMHVPTFSSHILMIEPDCFECVVPRK